MGRAVVNNTQNREFTATDNDSISGDVGAGIVTHNPESPYSLPDTGIIISWSCDDWVTWHKAMKKAFGKVLADTKWMKAWNDQSFFDWNVSWCKYGSNFNEYVRDEKLPVSWALPNVIADTNTTISNVSSSINSASNLFTWLVPLGVITLFTIGIVIVYKKSKLA